jgi:uncharacterized protein
MAACTCLRARWLWLARLMLAAIVFTGGCAAKPQDGLPTTSMRIGSRTFDVEIARSDSERQTGLMNRSSMPADHGMIFVFDHEQTLVFWMKDTLIPLDIIFTDANGKVVSVRQMKAKDLTDIFSEGLAEYAIELNLGAASAAGVLPGDHLDIPAAARAQPATAP